MSSFSRADGEEVGFVGIGTGAYIALAIARLLVEEKDYVPAGLWLINPTMRLPWASTAMPGVLKTCPVYTLVDENSTYGPAWRYEVSTLGPYTTNIFDDI